VCRETVVRLQRTESALVRSLERDSLLVDRVERLMTIPAVGPITALTWALEVGDVQRFSSIKKAISYCGLCGVEKSSGSTVQRTPLSKQRNKHLQTTLIEAAKMAPRNSRSWHCSMTKRSRRATPIAQRWQWRESWWPTSWRSTVGSGIFK
jgi:transposase